MKKKRVLIIRLSSLGDVIFNLPLANVLKSNGYDVDWITSEKGFDVIKNNPLVDKAFLAPVAKWKKQNFFEKLPEYFQILKSLRARHYDIAIDTQLLIKSFIWTAFSGAKRRIVAKSAREFSFLGGNEIIDDDNNNCSIHIIKIYLKYAEHLGLDVSNIDVALPESTEETIKKIDKLLENIDNTKPLVAIAPATTWDTKHWNKENWKKLISKIENDYTLVFTGTSKDKELIEYISDGKHLSIAGQTNILELAEVFKRCKLLISLDSGSTHLAWATKKPKIVSIFCATPTARYAPLGDESKYISVTGHLQCQPCHKRRCTLKKNKNVCTYFPSVEDVLEAINKLLPLKESANAI